uniref:Glucosylceramidase n=1 Tax=Meloidogyne incognita TaxID=6306 RepID=A0A914LSM5_MELIC
MLKFNFKSTLYLFFLNLLLIFFVFPLLFSGYLAAEIIETEELKECLQKTFEDSETFVCVCNSEYCDEVEPLGLLAKGKIVFYLTDKRKNRMKKVLKHFPFNKTDDNKLPTISIDSSTRFQTIIGFGGAFTDSVGLNLNSLNATTRESLIKNYFHPEEGIGYSIGRVPIASTDFSTREYSYVEQEGDFELKTFSLAKEDFEYKIPYIKMANRYRIGQPFRLLAAPWASPGWMKTNGKMNGDGELKGDLNGPYYHSYAKYLKKFFDEYHANGIDFWALTIQNQPESGLEKDFPFQTMFMSNRTQRYFNLSYMGTFLNFY